LEHEADVGKRLAHGLLPDVDRAGRRRRQARPELQQRALAAPTRAPERDELVGLDLQRDVLDGVHEVAAARAVGLGDPVEPDHERAGAAYLSNGSGVATAARQAAATNGARRPASTRASPEARCCRSAASWARA